MGNIVNKKGELETKQLSNTTKDQSKNQEWMVSDINEDLNKRIQKIEKLIEQLETELTDINLRLSSLENKNSNKKLHNSNVNKSKKKKTQLVDYDDAEKEKLRKTLFDNQDSGPIKKIKKSSKWIKKLQEQRNAKKQKKAINN